MSSSTRWYAGSDHAGLALKNELVMVLRDRGCEVTDLGTTTDDSVDYPDFAEAVAKRVVAEDALGLLVCGTGNGIMMSANKVRGARAALATESFTARMARLHNNANIIAFGARVVGAGVASDALVAFLEAEFEGGRHQRRVDKMMAIEE